MLSTVLEATTVVAPGITTRNKKLLVAKGIATGSKKLLDGREPLQAWLLPQDPTVASIARTVDQCNNFSATSSFLLLVAMPLLLVVLQLFPGLSCDHAPFHTSCAFCLRIPVYLFVYTFYKYNTPQTNGSFIRTGTASKNRSTYSTTCTSQMTLRIFQMLEKP